MRRAVLPLLLCCVAGLAHAQGTHRGHGRDGRTLQTVAFVDAWEDGDTGPERDGLLDVLTRTEVVSEPKRRVTASLLLFGPWGQHLYAADEERVSADALETTSLRTSWRAVDLDGDGRKELLFLERSVRTKVLVDDQGVEAAEPGPFFADAGVGARYLAREGGALVEHALDADASTPAMKALLQLELGGATNAWLHLLAAESDFSKQQYEQARYRYAVVREWAERQLLPREVQALSPALPLPSASPDDPAVLWMAATRRIGALPRWYQRR